MDSRSQTSPRDLTEIRNRVVLQLRPAAREFFARRALTREISPGEVLYEEGTPFTHAVFPHEGVISLMAEMEDGKTVEKTSIGHEGFIGFSLLMGGSDAISRTVVQVPGYASWLSIEDLDENWSEELAAIARNILIDAFTLMPRDKRVINAHIRYNSIAVQNGGKRHAPTTRTDV